MKHKILGVDPGTLITGFGIILVDGNRHYLVDCGTIETKKCATPALKYLMIFEEISRLIETHQPAALSVETQYVDKNVQSAIKLGMARGVITLAAAKQNVPVFEYAPSKAKLAVTGNGSAPKAKVGQMIKLLLGLKEAPSSEDASDALAIALAHAHFSRSHSCLIM